MLLPNFKPFPEIKTERLILRKLSIDDADAILKLRADEDVMRYIGKEPITLKSEAIEFIDRVNESLETNYGITWAVALQQEPGNLIGTIGHWRLIKEHYRAEVGYMLQRDYWRQGIMKEALFKVIDFGFNEMQLHSIEAHINPLNIASASILEATGFVREAYFKEDFFFKGVFSDTAIYSKLRY
jgi:[ribosomal protein S5]-alanine N-acetyltransferase